MPDMHFVGLHQCEPGAEPLAGMTARALKRLAGGTAIVERCARAAGVTLPADDTQPLSAETAAVIVRELERQTGTFLIIR